MSIFISKGFSMWKLLLDKLDTKRYPDLSIVLTVSVLFLLKVPTVSLDVFDFYVFLTVSIFFFAETGYVLAYLTTFSGFLFFVNCVNFFIGVIDASYLSFLCFFEGTYF